MGKLGGFLQIERHGCPQRDPAERAHDYREFVQHARRCAELREQGARCMDCGVPFCHNGCPLGNLIPDWNDLVYRDRWQEAIEQLHAHQQLPRVHRPPVPRAVRGGLRARDPRGRRGDDQADRARDRRTAPGTRAGSCPQPPRRETGQSVAVDRLRARPGWPAPSSCAARATA